MPKKRRKPLFVVSRQERVQATPQTIAKARGCLIRRLYEASLIDGQEQDAARQCEKISRKHKLGWFHMEAAE